MELYVWAGRIVGGTIAILLLSWLIEWALLKRVLNDAVQGKVGSVIAAFLIAAIIYSMNGDPLNALIAYGVPALPIAIWKRSQGIKARDHEFDGLEDTFR